MTDALLQSATEGYYEKSQVFYYKMRQLSQNATIVKNCDSTPLINRLTIALMYFPSTVMILLNLLNRF